MCAHTDSFYERGAFHESCLLTKNMQNENKFPINAEALTFNPLNAELNPICNLLALLGAHLILHVSRIRVKNRASYI
jgi:hypothetical protein